MIEAQSTWTVNILVRVLMYLAKSYQDYIIRIRQDIYGSKRVKFPKPELYVIYTGNQKTRPEVLSFAQEFFPEQESFLDIKVKMLYGGGTKDIIGQYAAFIKVFDGQKIWVYRTGGAGNHPHLQRQECAEKIFGKQGKRVSGYYDYVV